MTAYYETPALADGTTAAPNRRSDYRLLLSAVVNSSGTTPTTTGTTTTTGTNGTTTVFETLPAPPVIGNPTQSHSVWREGTKLASFARGQRPPVGTTFAFGLGAAAKVTFAFRQHLGRRTVPAGTLSFTGHPGTDRLFFQGRLSRSKKLRKGRYTVTITAANGAGSSRPVSLNFTITA
ncbi:MAG TPA: hypothetical protein VMP89_05480 [Solirubrobacteraceae bacterium]|nr:hypothetical protein [Solirubrobacteraceae bacterium]